jgi:hypothetical protein
LLLRRQRLGGSQSEARQANSFQDHISKKSITQKAGGGAGGVAESSGSEFKPSTLYDHIDRKLEISA